MSEKVDEVACPACGDKRLRIEYRFEATDRPFSLAGAQMKVPVYKWPWLVCDGCGVEARAKG